MGKSVTTDARTKLTINTDRLMASLDELGKIGAYRDDEADDMNVMGVCRLALSPEDALGRRLVRDWFEEAGLTVSTDAIGNTYADRAGFEPDLARGVNR